MGPTRYTVVAIPAADDELLSIWLNAGSERADVTRASHLIETTLRTDAGQQGVPDPTPASPSRRALLHYPLRALFEVSEPDRLVRIIGFEKISSTP